MRKLIFVLMMFISFNVFSQFDINWNKQRIDIINDNLSKNVELVIITDNMLVYNDIIYDKNVSISYIFNEYGYLKNCTYQFKDNSNYMYNKLKKELVKLYGNFKYSKMVLFYQHLVESTYWSKGGGIYLNRLVDKGHFVNITLKFKKN